MENLSVMVRQSDEFPPPRDTVLGVLNDKVYCDLKSRCKLVARVSFSLVLKEEGGGRDEAQRGESFSRSQ